jgi:hypothetical protein
VLIVNLSKKSVDRPEYPRYDTPMNTNRCANCEGRHIRGNCPADPDGNWDRELDFRAEDDYYERLNDK